MRSWFGIIIFETLTMILGMIFLPRHWIMLLRARDGRVTQDEYQYLRRYKSYIINGVETFWMKYTVTVWFIVALFIDWYTWLVLDQPSLWMGVLVAWMGTYLLTTLGVRELALRGTFEPR